MTQPAPASRHTVDSLRQRVARTIHRYDNHHALSGNDIPSKHHYGEADAVLAELKREMDALAEYENAITWLTTCLACARVLDSGIRETERAERAEAAHDAVRKLHERDPDADYCAVCSNHGDTTWPCATIQALDADTDPKDQT
jgi:hypothetical protein